MPKSSKPSKPSRQSQSDKLRPQRPAKTNFLRPEQLLEARKKVGVSQYFPEGVNEQK